MSVTSIPHLTSNFYIADIIDIVHHMMDTHHMMATHHMMDTHHILDMHHMMDTHYMMNTHYDDEHPSYDGSPSHLTAHRLSVTFSYQRELSPWLHQSS